MKKTTRRKKVTKPRKKAPRKVVDLSALLGCAGGGLRMTVNSADLVTVSFATIARAMIYFFARYEHGKFHEEAMAEASDKRIAGDLVDCTDEEMIGYAKAFLNQTGVVSVTMFG